MKTCILLSVMVGLLATVASARKTESPSMHERVQFLEAQGYDKHIRPHHSTGENRTTVSVLVILNSITSIDEINMDLDVDMFVMRQWQDTRLLNISMDEKVMVFGELQERLWVPNFYFVNSKTAKYHNVTTLNRETYIEPYTGTVYMNVRVTVKVSCPMELWNFPMDNQTCVLNMQSDIHDYEVVYKWVDEDPVSVNSDVTLPKFNLLQLPTPHSCLIAREQNMANGAYSDQLKYSCLKLDIHIVRQFGYYLIQIYIPSICLVMMSWVSFWLTVESTPARASVGAITVLTITTMSGSASQTSPKVSYLKALDIWFLTITGFVFAAFFEFAIVNTVFRTTRKRKLRNLQKRRKKLQDQRIAAQQANANQIRNNIYTQAEENNAAMAQPVSHIVNSTRELEPAPGDQLVPSAPQAEGLPQNGVPESPCVDWEDHMDDSVGCCCCTKSAECIDVTSRWLFPAAFIVFNAIYWRVYGAFTVFGDWDNISESVDGNGTDTRRTYGVFFD